MSETAQVQLKCGRVQAPAGDAGGGDAGSGDAGGVVCRTGGRGLSLVGEEGRMRPALTRGRGVTSSTGGREEAGWMWSLSRASAAAAAAAAAAA